MSERKSINKYYPPDFDPSKIKKVKKKSTGSASWQMVRLMIPFSMKCTNCEEYIASRKKFNAKKEDTKNTYLGLKIVRFHVKCPRCFGDIVFRTDPQNDDFLCESGCVRIHEPSANSKDGKGQSMEEILERLQGEELEERLAKEGKEKIDETAIEQLERRLKEQQREQELIDEIEQLQNKRTRLDKTISKISLVDRKKKEAEELELEDMNAAKEAFQKFQQQSKAKPETLTGELINGGTTPSNSLLGDYGGSSSDDDDYGDERDAHDSDKEAVDGSEELKKEVNSQNVPLVFKRKITNKLGILKKKQKIT